MTVALEEAQAGLARMLAHAEADEEVFIGPDSLHPVAKLVPLTTKPPRSSRHPGLVGSTQTHDLAALVKPLPPGEWGELAER